MCYLQLTLAGIPAQVIRGNSLSLEIFESAWTASAIPFLGQHGDIFSQPHPDPPPLSLPTAPIFTEITQLALF